MRGRGPEQVEILAAARQDHLAQPGADVGATLERRCICLDLKQPGICAIQAQTLGLVQDIGGLALAEVSPVAVEGRGREQV